MAVNQQPGDLPQFPAERLTAFHVDVLSDLLHLHEDRLPRSVIDECARRGDAMVEVLAPLAQDGSYWRENVASGEWWALHHAVMILGLVPGERAGDALIAFMRRMNEAGDENLQEWLSGCWDEFFVNKPASAVDALRAVARDRKLDWYIRTEAADAVVALAEREGGEALDVALDWAAALAADETENWDLRLLTAGKLLDFASARHRPLLEDLARRQSRGERVFDTSDIAKTYSGEAESPARHAHEDPWKFYAPDQIAERQTRWTKVDAEAEAEAVSAYAAPYVREQPKVGRNDPCPCGSGKKYKRCCLAAHQAADSAGDDR